MNLGGPIVTAGGVVFVGAALDRRLHAYDVETGRMVRGPQGIFAKIPGLGAMFKALTAVAPLGRAKVIERDGDVYLEG